MRSKDHPTIIISAERSRTFARRLREALRERHGVDLKLNEAQALTAIAAEVRGGWHAVARMTEPETPAASAGPEDLPGDPVWAEMHDDLHHVELKIDVRRWLAEAEPEEIAELASGDWAFCEAADAVYHFYEELGSARPDEDVSDLSSLLTALNRSGTSRESVGFGVSVDGPEATAWLVANRPEAARMIDEDENGPDAP
ncbi:MAG: hypothetical protein DI629_20940 [Mesorhizobium amorphae]|nr:MAG: hypothetical protein DI629_20940 [Mesorhizobium amorphae]